MSAAATSQRPGPSEQPRVSMGTEGAERPRRGRFAVGLILTVLTALSVAWRLWLVRHTGWLTVRIDEDGYLLLARVLSGGPGGVTSENPMFRHVGYPLLITPVYWFTRDPLEVYHIVQIINAVVNSLTLPLAYLVARRVFGLSRALSVVTGATVASIPAVVFYSGFALTDAVLAPLFAGWILAVHAAVTRAGIGRGPRHGTASPGRAAALAGILAGALWLVHVRSIVIVAVHVVVFAVLGLRRWLPARAVVASWVGIAVSILIDLVGRAVIGDAVVMGGDSPAGTLTQRLFTPFGIVHTLNWAIGQVWYLTVSTLGLAALGAVATVRWLRRREPGSTGRTVFLLVLVAVTVGIALLSAATLPDGDRINLYAYGRYVAFTAPLWMVVAVAALARPAVARLPVPASPVPVATSGSPGPAPAAGPSLWSPPWAGPTARLVGVAAAVLVASAFLVVSYSRRLQEEAFLAFDAPEASALTLTWDRLRLAAVTAVVLFAMVCLAALLSGRRTRVAGLGLVLAASLLAMPAITAHAAQPMSRDFTPAVALGRDAGVTPADTVAVDSGLTWWAQANVQVEVTWAAVPRFDARTTPPPKEATVVVARWRSPHQRWSWNGTRAGWRVVALDEKAGAAVWRRP